MIWALRNWQGLAVGIALVIAGACAFIWWDRRQKMQEHGI